MCVQSDIVQPVIGVHCNFRLELNMDLPSAQGSAIGATASTQASQEQVGCVFVHRNIVEQSMIRGVCDDS